MIFGSQQSIPQFCVVTVFSIDKDYLFAEDILTKNIYTRVSNFVKPERIALLLVLISKLVMSNDYMWFTFRVV